MLPACPLEIPLHQALCPLSSEGPEHNSLGVGASGGDAQSRCLEKLLLRDSQCWGMTFYIILCSHPHSAGRERRLGEDAVKANKCYRACVIRSVSSKRGFSWAG